MSTDSYAGQDYMNIKTKTLYERYLKIVPPKFAFVMACVDGGQKELAKTVLELEQQDQEILRQETHACLVPREELYPLDENEQSDTSAGRIKE